MTNNYWHIAGEGKKSLLRRKGEEYDRRTDILTPVYSDELRE
jgi:hypothetical protein